MSMGLGDKLLAKRVADRVALAVPDPDGTARDAMSDLLKRHPPSITSIIDQVLDQSKEVQNFFRPSGLFGCDRSAVFHYQRAPSHPGRQSNQLLRILDNGTAVHEVVQRYLSLHPDVWFAPEAKVVMEVEGALIKGSCDGVLIRRADGYRWGIEIKTINAKGFKELEGPKEAHVLQASLYARMQGLWWISILYWNKDSQALKEYPVQYDSSIWKDTKARVKELKRYVDEGELPAYNADTCDTTFCGFVDHCRKQGAPV